MQTLADYLKAHLDLSSGQGDFAHGIEGRFYTVARDLRAFKAVVVSRNAVPGQERGIANITIPADAMIYVGWGVAQRLQSRRLGEHRTRRGPLEKLRASKAVVHSVVTVRGEPADWACSYYVREFSYVAGEEVVPQGTPFSLNKMSCQAGIHFFLTLGEARAQSLAFL
ncbi:MAG: DUF5758 domain-containing protein [Betaproteobacteria bacterium]